eukprot:jgi/Tetstr1/423619/TSEL_001391.t1
MPSRRCCRRRGVNAYPDANSGAAALLLLLAALLGCALRPSQATGRNLKAAVGKVAFRPDLAGYSMHISADSAAAQAAFDEGLNLAWNFNQAMAAEAFRRCAHEDAAAAMCHWGLAYAAGPFLNAPRKPASELRRGREAAATAAGLLRADAPAKEAGVVGAMLARYPEHPAGDIPSASYEEYETKLEALLEGLHEFDADVAVLLAEAKMDLQCDEDGYHFLGPDGHWTARSAAAARLLREALARSPGGTPHPMAAHLLIHLTEGGRPGAEASGGGAAEGLQAAWGLMASMAGSQANHLQHMPAHTLMRTGRYAEAVNASLAAVGSDAAYLAGGALPYGPGHNLAVGVLAASMAGMAGEASRLGAAMLALFRDAPDRPDGPGADTAWALPMTTPLRLGRFEEALAFATADMPPPRDWSYAWVLYDYTRGCALLALGRHEEGAAHLAALRERLPALPDVVAGEGEVAALVLGAAVDVHRSHDARAAEAKLRAAAARQADWGYTEPPRWHQPVADCLGQVLLDAGSFQAAADAFLSSLAAYVESPFALWGLQAALDADPGIELPKGAADHLRGRLAAAWAHADGTLHAACPALRARRPLIAAAAVRRGAPLPEADLARA